MSTPETLQGLIEDVKAARSDVEAARVKMRESKDHEYEAARALAYHVCGVGPGSVIEHRTGAKDGGARRYVIRGFDRNLCSFHISELRRSGRLDDAVTTIFAGYCDAPRDDFVPFSHFAEYYSVVSGLTVDVQ